MGMFPVGLAAGVGLGIAIGIGIGKASARKEPLAPEEKRRQRKLVMAGLATLALGVITLVTVFVLTRSA
jgi:hypothetical protein